MDPHIVKLSKFLSLILRHKPQTIGLNLDGNGWAKVDDLIELVNEQGIPLTGPLLTEIVHNNDKDRFTFNADRTKIRAYQGHSIEVDLELISETPPAILYHGTATRFLASIRARGLVSGSRQHVHLSPDEITAIKVGQRHGRPVVLTIRAEEMSRSGYQFFCAENGVWLTETVPPQYIHFPTSLPQNGR